MSIGDFIREKRLDKGLLQKELAEQIGITNIAMNFIEKGKTKPSIVTMRKLADALGMNYFELRQVLKKERE